MLPVDNRKGGCELSVVSEQSSTSASMGWAGAEWEGRLDSVPSRRWVLVRVVP